MDKCPKCGAPAKATSEPSDRFEPFGWTSYKYVPMCELPNCGHGVCWCGHAECSHADENVQPNCSDCDCDGFEEAEEDAPHGDQER